MIINSQYNQETGLCQWCFSGNNFQLKHCIWGNPTRKREIEQTREAKLTRLHIFAAEKNAYLAHHPKADPAIACRDIGEKIKQFTMDTWLHAVREERTIRLIVDDEALRETTLLDGCYVIKSDVPRERADRDTLHDRYKDPARVEQDFRDMKTAHLEVRPVEVRKEKRTRGHVFVVILALLLKRSMEKLLRAAYDGESPAVREALASLDRLCCQEQDIGGIPFRYVPVPDERQSAYLATLGVTLPTKLLGRQRCAHVI